MRQHFSRDAVFISVLNDQHASTNELIGGLEQMQRIREARRIKNCVESARFAVPIHSQLNIAEEPAKCGDRRTNGEPLGQDDAMLVAAKSIGISPLSQLERESRLQMQPSVQIREHGRTEDSVSIQ